jgi:hypothetical protein
MLKQLEQSAVAELPSAQVTAGLAPFLDRVCNYVNQSRSANTLRGYRADWRHFAKFAAALGMACMPATPELVLRRSSGWHPATPCPPPD